MEVIRRTAVIANLREQKITQNNDSKRSNIKKFRRTE